MRKFAVAAATAAVFLTCCIGSFASDVSNKTVWGNPSRGVAISANAVKAQYKLGGDVELQILVKNLGKMDVNLHRSVNEFSDYRIAMYDSQGSPVAYSEEYQNFRPAGTLRAAKSVADYKPMKFDTELKPIDKPSPEKNTEPDTHKVTKLVTGEILAEPEVVVLNHWFKIEQPGTYTVVIMRRVWNWDTACPISNQIKIDIVK